MAKAKGVTVAFLGTGAMEVDNATDLVEDYIEATITSDDDPVRFVFPLSTDEFSETLRGLVEMAQKSDITYEVVTSTSDKGRRTLVDIAETAAKTYHVADMFLQIEQILTEAGPSAVLEVLWDKEREEELTEVVRKFLDAEIDVRDLTDGNAPITDQEEDEVETEAEKEIIKAAEAETQNITQTETKVEEAEIIYRLSDFNKMSRADIRAIAVKLGLPPRKSSSAMIEQILDAQGGYQKPAITEEPREPAEPLVVDIKTGEILEVDVSSAELAAALEGFPGRIHDVLDQFLTDLGKTIEGVIFNATPEAPPEIPQEPTAPTRRLSRSR
jgi:hypothetical protein